jgi:hypothetical protein
VIFLTLSVDYKLQPIKNMKESYWAVYEFLFSMIIHLLVKLLALKCLMQLFLLASMLFTKEYLADFERGN